MKTKDLFLRHVLIAILGLIPAGPVLAQTFMTLHSFTVINGVEGTNGDGAHLRPLLILSGDTLYGMARDGGSLGKGTVFAVNTDGTGFTNLHSFTGGSDGSGPRGGLLLSGDSLYGTAYQGGSSGNGTVFKVSTDGTGFITLHHFGALFVAPSGNSTNRDGANPRAGLVLSGSMLYGTAIYGGSSGAGTVFAVSTNGTGFTNLHNFVFSNGGGTIPWAGLTVSGDTLYGTTPYGGSSDSGTVYAVNTDGSRFTTLNSFTADSGPPYYTNSGGSFPFAGVILSGSTLFGTTYQGGSFGNGTVFALNTNGTGFTTVYSFKEATPDPGPYTNSNGSNPLAGLILSGNTLYGAAAYGGSSGNGTLFAVSTNGTGFTNLHTFTATNGVAGTNGDGAYPYGSLLLTNYTLYGTAFNGGSSGNGTVFSLSFAPHLSIFPSGTNVVLTWPTNVVGFDYSGFSVHYTTDLLPSTVWTTNSQGPVIADGQNTVTNPISGLQKFFRLSQ